ncbi:hypothetical protein NLU13_7964 [Sarocladium strictum]|uniref:BAR domain-containing protein n=1 Tax=Sarocladium strictum TaxID=5046 RepID=A0AA39GAR6_SARSR|nr:hypothetical protein NLU13_7964 [Sarocladium strictum]
MMFTKKIDRAFQWAGEKMGAEAKTTHSDEFKMLETEMSLRHDGAEKLHKSASVYIKWNTRRCDGFEDKERNTPIGFLGRAMTVHGEDFEPESEFGNCLSSLGQANERIAAYQESYLETASETWLEHLERTVATMKDYQAARKKLESRRLAYDASTTKLQKSKRDDFRAEDEVRANKVKFEESSEDVLRRMQDIKEAEADSIAALTSFLDAELEYHDRCAEELRRVRQSWAAGGGVESSPLRQHLSQPAAPRVRSRSNTARSWQEPRHQALYEEPEPSLIAVRTIPPSPTNRGAPLQPPRPTITRSVTSENRVPSRSSLRAVPHQLSRVATDSGTYGLRNEDVFADDVSTGSGSRSPDWGERSVSPATSYGSLSHSTTGLGARKAPPPPPVNRAKKPPPPPVPRKVNIGL